MSGQMKKYRESLVKTPEQITKKMDLRGVMLYAREKGVKVSQLTDSKKMLFMK